MNQINIYFLILHSLGILNHPCSLGSLWPRGMWVCQWAFIQTPPGKSKHNLQILLRSNWGLKIKILAATTSVIAFVGLLACLRLRYWVWAVFQNTTALVNVGWVVDDVSSTWVMVRKEGLALVKWYPLVFRLKGTLRVGPSAICLHPLYTLINKEI